MNTKHTPGPWKPMSHGETISINALGKDTYLGVAHVNARGNFNAGIPSKADRANAQLIAAAPELLDACQLALNALDKLMGDSDLPNDDSDEMKACQALSAVIAKAKGARRKE